MALLPKILGVSVAASALFLAGCGGDPGGPNPGPSLNCAQVQPTTVAVGAFAIVDPTAQGACVSLPSVPAAGSGGAEHLYLAVSTAGAEVANGITAPYSISGNPSGLTASVGQLPSPLVSAFRGPANAPRFHRMLRERERMLARDPRRMFDARHGRLQGPSFAAAPAQGSEKDFFVCTDTNCGDFVSVRATAEVVRDKVAIYVDNASTVTQRYTALELNDIAQVFDDFLYPIDTLNFGRESDIDANGVVQVLLTPKINELSPNCNSTGSVILGYFFGQDLEAVPNSNNGEVFYSLVPDPLSTATTNCDISKSFAQINLAPTFVHEFQHMISYNQHAIVRDGDPEETWLNEGLSHYAEELAGRLVPDTTGQAPGTTYNQYALSNYLNAYDYLENPEAAFLISPAGTGGSLEERGAGWLFVRWIADQFDNNTPSGFRVRGTDFTRALVQTNLNGAANIEAESGETFSTLVTQWQLANYLSDLSGFTPSSQRLRYITLNIRQQFATAHDRDPGSFPRVYPLVPDSTKTGTYTRTGTLRQGSGRHVRIIQSSGAEGVQLLLTNNSGGQISAAAVPRVGLVRVR
ncbi:MAG TPA: hypothetical protein VFM14_12380 [Gemmatimonadales bacterium]|nr:hypothetical protein [Gemmatimonadales bacterium]